MMRRRQQIRQTACSLVAMTAAVLLSGCVAATNDAGAGAPIDSMLGKKAMTERRLATAAIDAIAEGKSAEALVSYEKLYKRSFKNADVSLNYAQLLRKAGRVDEALAVLKPFAAKDGSLTAGNPPLAMIKTEYAAALIARGDFAEAQKLLDTVLTAPEAAEFHPDASHLAGIALDAQGNHKAAEKLFRQALDSWKGDPTSVMNNLALNLASQGMFDESLTTLRRAQVMAPDKTEIAQNIEIVNDLRRAVVPSAPVNIKK
jgi:Flp pilus assembly protein TadD